MLRFVQRSRMRLLLKLYVTMSLFPTGPMFR